MDTHFDQYKIELGKSKYDVIVSRERERELLKRYKEHGDKEAFETLVHSNMRFVMYVMKEFSIQPSIEIMDIIQEGNNGLIVGIKRFDIYKYPDIKLFSYVVWWIRFFIRKALSAHRAYENRRASLMTDEQLESTTRPALNSIDVRMFFKTEPDIEAEKIAVEDINNFLLTHLDKREAAILRLYYGLGEHNHHPHTLQSIGQQLHIKFVRVRQIRDRALEKLHDALEGDSLDDHM